jgi:uncharacterized protein YbjQ (UPF0145 family)
MARHRLVECVFAVGLAVSSTGVLAQAPAEAAPVRVYDATQITPDRYTVIRRVWVESWRSAFFVPVSRNAGDAITALVSEAGRVGADGVVNLHCLEGSDGLFPVHGYYCYGNAIKLKNP